MKIRKFSRNFPQSRKFILAKINFGPWRSRKFIPAKVYTNKVFFSLYNMLSLWCGRYDFVCLFCFATTLFLRTSKFRPRLGVRDISLIWAYMFLILFTKLDVLNPFSAKDELTRFGPWKWHYDLKSQNLGISRGFWAKWMCASCSTFNSESVTSWQAV